jgi:predicted dehydrogenase
VSNLNSTFPALVDRVRAGQPVGVGIVGFGASPDSWAETAHLPALRAVPGYELRGVSASSLRSASTAAERHGVPFAFESAADLAAHDAIDLVVISVRVPRHADAISDVLGSGKIIFSEWPLGVDTAEAKCLASRAATLGTRTAVGLQARFNPAVAYLHDLIRDGYVGEVLSSSLIGSGGYWGPETANEDEYLLDESTGATMRSIAFGHALDALSHVVGEPVDLRVEQATRRNRIRNTDSDAKVSMTAADQVWFSGRTPGGAVLTGHYRGGAWRGTNLLWEILGTDGEIRVTAPNGHVQVQPLTLWGASDGDQALRELPVPATYVRVNGIDPVRQGAAFTVAHTYEQLLRDLRDETSVVPSWEHAVRRHASIDLTKKVK